MKRIYWTGAPVVALAAVAAVLRSTPTCQQRRFLHPSLLRRPCDQQGLATPINTAPRMARHGGLDRQNRTATFTPPSCKHLPPEAQRNCAA